MSAAIDNDRLSQTFAALASATRRALMARLAEGEATVSDLAAPFDLTMPAVSKHLKVLERAGLIQRSRHAQYRPCRLEASPLAEVVSWAEHYRPIWEARLDRMESYVGHLQQVTKAGERDD